VINEAITADLLNTVSRQLNSSLDLDEVLGKVLGLTVEVTGAGRGSLFLIDENGSVVQQILARPNQAPSVSNDIVQKVMTEGLAGWVYQHREPALVPDTRLDERWVRLPNDEAIMGAALVIPLLYQGRVNGLLALHHERLNFFGEEHMSLVAGIASQAAIAVENARLFTQVKHEREALEALIRGMPIPVLVIDTDERVVLRNRAAEQSLFIHETNLPLASMVGGGKLQAALELLRTERDSNVEVGWPDQRVFNVSISSVSQHGTVVALHDITYLKELDELKSQFVETVSHDLKNPLSTIKGYATILTLSENLSEQERLDVSHILDATDQMQALIEDLLDLARIEAGMGGDVECCDVTQIVRDTLDQFELQLKDKEMALVTELSQGIATVLGNPVRLSQVVFNLVGNAIKYTPQRGEICVRTFHKDSEYWFEVSDNGPGIAPAAQSHLFQKFFTAPTGNGFEQEGGTGLGLSIVKAIVEGYGGRVWVESELGLGSTFGCVLPEVKEEVID
jgi:signal transduction histidine kinase